MIVLFFLYTAIWLNVPSNAQVSSSLWQTDKSQHFIINYQKVSPGYIAEVIAKAEKYYNSIVDDLGYRRFDFWSWDNRAKIYLYNTNADYLIDSKRTNWSGACVNVSGRVIISFIGQDNFFDSILPHEMAHIIFREFIGNKADLPLWIEEGVACSHEYNSLKERLRTIKELIKEGVYIDLVALSTMTDYSKIGPKVFYSEAAALINFLLKQYGKDAFLDFSRQVRDGVKWQEAFKKSYHFENLNEFEAKWKEYFRE